MPKASPIALHKNQYQNNMKTKLLRTSLFALCTLVLASCGNINIVKRTYRPGYHIDMVKKKDRKVEAGDNQITKSNETKKQKEVAESVSQAYEIADIPEAKPDIMASLVKSVAPVTATTQPNVDSKRETRKYKLSDFRWSEKKKKSYKKPMFSSSDHWSAWVAFFAGAASLMFAFIALIVAFFGYALWPTAIVFGVAAIVFAILNKKKGWSGEKMRKLGLLFGIIGAGVGLLAMLLWFWRLMLEFL